ncbi:MAG TPA: PilT/PilU family type 4a pilus ATPase [Thermodesulfovibrionales bacterium]|nr:PilT/PilU family type 4a pilus ATPase [Thermodesulfovibrionales bacterium]
MSAKTLKEGPQRLGEILLRREVISQSQLKEALRVQSQTRERLGSILVQNGHISIDTLLGFLGEQLGIATANLCQFTITPKVVSVIPFEKMKEHKVVALTDDGKSMTLAMINPKDYSAIKDLEFITDRTIFPVLVLSYQINAAIRHIEDEGERLEGPLMCAELAGVREVSPAADSGHMELKQLFRKLVTEKASDLLLSAGVPPCLKKDNEIIRLSSVMLAPHHTRLYADELISADKVAEFERERELDFAYTVPEIGRFRVNIYKQRSTISIAVRHIIDIVPSLGELKLPLWIEDFVTKTQGLILVTGPTGHGKTTTLAAMVDVINRKRKCNIITIEDPVEYLHKHKASNVNQREVGTDTGSFHEGLRHIFRQAPDVIVIGEMRDPASFSIALQAADTGHLVLSTMHSNTATSTIERIIDIFPPHEQQHVRVQFAENFLLVFSQRLLPLKSGPGRVVAYEKLVNTYRVRNLIREGKPHHIRTMLQQSTDDFLSIDHSLANLCLQDLITQETGLKFSENPTYFTELVNRGIQT